MEWFCSLCIMCGDRSRATVYLSIVSMSLGPEPCDDLPVVTIPGAWRLGSRPAPLLSDLIELDLPGLPICGTPVSFTIFAQKYHVDALEPSLTHYPTGAIEPDPVGVCIMYALAKECRVGGSQS
jgi:hypothetical protein